MAATKADIREWFIRGKKEGATHMLVMCDTFDHDDYPVYIEAGKSAREEATKRNGESMQRLMECYDLRLPMDEQLNETRAFHY